MNPYRERWEAIDCEVVESTRLGMARLLAEDDARRARLIQLGGRDLLNFGSCSYLGLELDPRLARASIEAIESHGVQFSSSRSFLSHPLYGEAERLLEEIFRSPALLTASTTLGHLSAIPVLVDPDDAVLLDLQVHASVQMASRLAADVGARVELLPHNDMPRLERRVAALERECRNVWYMADGIYSMFGDRAPTEEVVAMLDRHPSMRFYVDDAHGMSWCGPRGSGSVLAHGPLHPRMVMATGLGKGFGAGGGALVFPDRQTRDRVARCGPAMMFGGPLQPPVVGAILASAKIHLSEEIEVLQAELSERIDHVQAGLANAGVPLASPPGSPVGFVAAGEIETCRNLVARLHGDGLYVNPAHYPATPARRTGARFLVTRFSTFDDLDRLVDGCARHWEAALRDTNGDPKRVRRRFGLASSAPAGPNTKAERTQRSPALLLESAHSIEKLDAGEWDRTGGSQACLGASAMRLFESAFGPEAGPENHWIFRYFIVRDAAGQPVLATVCTGSLWKSDMLAPADVSRAAEEARREDPLHQTERVFSQGCLLSEGDALWLREPAEHPISQAALTQFIEAARLEAERFRAEMLVLRDVPDDAEDLALAYERAGFIRMPAPTGHLLDPVPASREVLVAQLSRDHRRHHRRSVTPFDQDYHAERVGAGGVPLAASDLPRLEALYRNVRERNLELNTFPLPESFFREAARRADWEIVVLRAVPGQREGDDSIVGFFVAIAGPSGYIPLVAGLDYDFVAERGLYRQVLRHALDRGIELGAPRIHFGFGAELEKRRFGARPRPASLFLEVLSPGIEIDA